MSTPPLCNAQQPSPVPSPFDWGLFTALATAATLTGVAYAIGKALFASSVWGAAEFTSAAAGAGAIVALVLYYALKPDGCIRSTPKQQNVCLSGIVEDTVDLNQTAVDVLAPFAMGPRGAFDVVVKSMYWNLVTQNAFWVFCNSKGAAMLTCLIENKAGCGAKIGSMVGVAAGAVGGAILGAMAASALGAALGCTAATIFYALCVLLVLLVAAIVGAAVAYAGATVGGWVGEGIGAALSNPVADAWKGLHAGAVVTVQGNWVTDPDIGNNELMYTTMINRTDHMSTPPSFTTMDADNTAPDDCSLPPQPPR